MCVSISLNYIFKNKKIVPLKIQKSFKNSTKKKPQKLPANLFLKISNSWHEPIYLRALSADFDYSENFPFEFQIKEFAYTYVRHCQWHQVVAHIPPWISKFVNDLMAIVVCCADNNLIPLFTCKLSGLFVVACCFLWRIWHC